MVFWFSLSKTDNCRIAGLEWLFKSSNMEFLRDLWGFLRERRKWWLLPLILVILLIGVLIIFAESSAVGSFIYTLF